MNRLAIRDLISRFLISDDWWKRFLHEKDLADDQRRDTMELPPITNEKITEKSSSQV